VVSGAAVARQAARGLWDAAGIESTSVAALLSELRRGSEWGLSPRSVLIVDEAGMLGTRDLAELLTHAATAQAKVVLVGDHHQLPEIDAGGAFRALVARTDPVRLTVNRRQHEPHAREMLDLWRQSRVREAMTIAAEHGELVTSPSAEDLRARIVGDYCAAVMDGEDAVMITLRRADARDLNRRARAWFDDAGQLGSDRVDLAAGEFATGDLVVLKLNDRRLGVENGNCGRVVAVDATAGTLKVELSGDRTVTLPRDYLGRRTARGEPTIVHGYAGTAHIAQGSTTGRAFVLGSDAYREWGYVAWARAREQTRFYICEPAADEHDTGIVQPRLAFDEVVRTMEHSRAKHAAVDLVGRADRHPGSDPPAAVGRALVARRDPTALHPRGARRSSGARRARRRLGPRRRDHRAPPRST
jgi:ATP-dependent exoDNAse (exonuclease V) alpha subunit